MPGSGPGSLAAVEAHVADVIEAQLRAWRTAALTEVVEVDVDALDHAEREIRHACADTLAELRAWVDERCLRCGT